MWYGVRIYVWFTPECNFNAKRTHIERMTKNVPRMDPQIRELSGNDLNPAREARTDKIVENKNPPRFKKIRTYFDYK